MRDKVLPAVLLILFSICTLYATTPSEQRVDAWEFHPELSEAEEKWASELEVSLITIGPAKPLYSWFGHSALMITDEKQSYLFDYGVFNTQKKGFYKDFLKGRMNYSIIVSDGERRIEREIAEGRSVKKQTLNLDASTKYGIYTFLFKEVQPEYNHYLYHFYLDNCATRIRDIIDGATDGAIRQTTENSMLDASFRSLSNRALKNSTGIFLALNTIQGCSVDRPVSRWESMFLPGYLSEEIEKSGLVESSEIISAGGAKSDRNRFVTIRILLFSLLFSAAVFLCETGGHRKLWLTLNTAATLLLALAGVVLIYGSFFTDLDMLAGNINMLFINPLLIAVTILLYKRKESASQLLSLFAIITLGTALLSHRQNSSAAIALVLPYYTTGLITVCRQKLDRTRRSQAQENHQSREPAL